MRPRKENLAPPIIIDPFFSSSFKLPMVVTVNNCNDCTRVFSAEFKVICSTCGEEVESRGALAEHNHHQQQQIKTKSPSKSAAGRKRARAPVKATTTTTTTTNEFEVIDLEDDEEEKIKKRKLEEDLSSAITTTPNGETVVQPSEAKQQQQQTLKAPRQPKQCGQNQYSFVQSDSSVVGVGDPLNPISSSSSYPCVTCDICGTCFRYERNLKLHRDNVHFSEERVKCPHCPKTFKHKIILGQHIRTHKDPLGEAKRIVFRCCKCDARPENRAGLKEHLEREHPGTESEKRKCPDCDYSDKCEELCLHLQMEHQNPNKKKMLHCEICGRGLANIHSYRKHKTSLHEPTARSFQCEKCPKMYKTRKEADEHCSRVHGDADRPSRCAHCPFVAWPVRMAQHVRKNHVIADDKDNVVCPTCGKTCWSPEFLQKHIRETHSGAKFRCEHCGKVFGRIQGLQFHVRLTHSAAAVVKVMKDYQCQHCDYKSPHKDVVRDHVQAMHRKGRKKTGPEGKKKAEKKKAEKTKEPRSEECHVCDKKVLKGQMRKHMVTVHGTVANLEEEEEKDAFECERCGKGFAQELMLLSHMEIVHKFVEEDDDSDDDD